MPDILLSPNMSLPVPVVGLEAGPQYATDVNSCMTRIDAHNHAPGSGLQIDPTGLNINSDLTMGSNNLISIRTLRMNQQSAALSLPTDLSCLYDVGGDMYFNDGLGNQIRITQNGSVVGTSGSIANLVSPATASFVSATHTFVWQSDTNTPANMDGAAVILRKVAANSPGITLRPPTSISSDYEVVLPALPGATNFVSIDSSGNLAAAAAVAGGITLSMLVAAVAQALVPTGAQLPFAGSAAPAGFLLCDGSAVSRTTYAALFAVVGISAGQGDGSTTFNVPDWRGRFMRGVDGSAGRDPDSAGRTAMNTGGNTGNNVNSVQGNAFQTHSHGIQSLNNVPTGPYPNFGANPSSDGTMVGVTTVTGATGPTSQPTANETRPTNGYSNFIIKT